MVLPSFMAHRAPRSLSIAYSTAFPTERDRGGGSLVLCVVAYLSALAKGERPRESVSRNGQQSDKRVDICRVPFRVFECFSIISATAVVDLFYKILFLLFFYIFW